MEAHHHRILQYIFESFLHPTANQHLNLPEALRGAAMAIAIIEAENLILGYIISCDGWMVITNSSPSPSCVAHLVFSLRTLDPIAICSRCRWSPNGNRSTSTKLIYPPLTPLLSTAIDRSYNGPYYPAI